MQVQMRQTDLLQIDTYRVEKSKPARDHSIRIHLHMNPKWRSALEIIVAHEARILTFAVKISE